MASGSISECIDTLRGKKLQLAALPELDDAYALVAAIKAISKPWVNEKYELQIEFGMSRRYWIGLTDVASEGEWVWAQGYDSRFFWDVGLRSTRSFKIRDQKPHGTLCYLMVSIYI